MSTATTRWLILLAAGLFAFIFLFERRAPSTDQEAERASRLLPDLAISGITGLEIRQGTNLSVKIERSNDQWRLVSPVAAGAEPAGIERLLNALAQLRQRTRVAPQEIVSQTDGLGAFGLDPPGTVMVLGDGQNRIELRLGSQTVLGNSTYLQVVGRDGLFVVDAEILKALPKSANDWRDATLLDLSGIRFDRFEVRPSTNGFEVALDSTDRLWRMTKPIQTRADSARIEFLLRQLQMLRVSRFITDDHRADIEPYGLQTPERELVFGQGANDLLALQIGKSPTNDPSSVFVRRVTQSNVVLVARHAIEPLLAGFREFCDRRLMVFRPDIVERIEARAIETFALKRQSNQVWRIVEPFQAEADRVLVMEMLGNLGMLEFVEFEKEVVTDFANYGLDPPRRRYALLGAAASPRGGATNQVLAQVDIGNATGYKFYARRSTENSVVTMLDNGRLPQAAFHLRDRRIWSFSTNQVSSITVQQAGRTRKLLRTGPVQWANAPGSEGPVNPLSVEEAAYRLGQLRAQSWVACGEDQLARYGIPAIDHRITIELAGTERLEAYSIRFGRQAPSGLPYASVEVSGLPGPVVFECPALISQFVQSDLVIP